MSLELTMLVYVAGYLASIPIAYFFICLIMGPEDDNLLDMEGFSLKSLAIAWPLVPPILLVLLLMSLVENSASWLFDHLETVAIWLRNRIIQLGRRD